MPEQIEAGPGVAGDRPSPSHMDLGPLAVKLGLGDEARVREAARVFQAGGAIQGADLPRSIGGPMIGTILAGRAVAALARGKSFAGRDQRGAS